MAQTTLAHAQIGLRGLVTAGRTNGTDEACSTSACRSDSPRVTALALGRPVRVGVAGFRPPTPVGPSARSFATLKNDPRAWTASLVVITGVTLLARHPLARMIGTEVETPALPMSAATAPTASAPPASGVAQALAGATVAVPTHAPRNPFRALVTLDGRVLAPVPMSTTPARASAAPGTGRSTASTPTAIAVGPSAAGACTATSGTSHRVVAGDTLWTLAARATRSTDSARVTIAWHRLYDANRAVLGTDPSLLQVGVTLCVPSSI